MSLNKFDEDDIPDRIIGGNGGPPFKVVLIAFLVLPVLVFMSIFLWRAFILFVVNSQ